MRCPACDHDVTRTEAFLEGEVDRLTTKLRKAQQVATLRDQFAMAAVTGLIASPEFHGVLYQQSENQSALFAYGVADAMLEARKEAP